MARNKFHLLHVRVNGGLYDQLQAVVKSRPSSNLSDVVREAIGLITSCEKQSTQPVTFSGGSYQMLANLASELNRPASKVAEDCVFAVLDSIQHNRSPLIVEELKLRREYKTNSE